MISARKQLEVLYASGASVEEKRSVKAQIFAALRAELAQGSKHPERWQAVQLNNAQLASVATYTQWVPAFRAVLAQQQGDLTQFYQVVKAMSDLPKSERNALLHAALEDNRNKLAANP